MLLADTLLRAHTLLEAAFAHYFPGTVDPDDATVREHVKAEAETGTGVHSLDDELSPLVVFITRLIADETSRARMRDWLVPVDLDRSVALEARPDLVGRCLRLLGSAYHAALKDSVGEMLFALCDDDATTMSELLGYRNVAGLLFNKGILDVLPDPWTPRAHL